MHIHPRVLTVLGTYRCTAACEHCCFESNPHVQGRLSLEEILGFIDEAARFDSVELVVFSGGECFLLGDDLVAAVEFAAAKGLRTRCVTNGYWAKSLAAGRRTLGALRDAGLNELNVSTGDYHQQFVAEETVVNAAVLGVELGLENTLIVVELAKACRVSVRQLLGNPRLRDLFETTPASRLRIIDSPWMPTHRDDVIDQSAGRMLDRHNVTERQGCDNILNTVVLAADRKLGSCCGLTRARIPELNVEWVPGTFAQRLAESGRDFMKIWLAVEGPERILAWAAQKNPKIDWENRYSHHCHACLAVFDDPEVRRTIAAHYRERLPDVLARYDLMLRAQENMLAATP